MLYQLDSSEREQVGSYMNVQVTQWTSHIGRENPRCRSATLQAPSAPRPPRTHMTTLIFGNKISSTRQDVTLLIGRIALGIVLIAHGWQKFFTYGISGATASFEQMGIPAAGAAAVFAALVELVGGIALIVGFAVPLVG